MSRRQLLALGFTSREVELRMLAGRLLSVYRGVYAVGHEALSDRGRMIAGLLAAGPGAALSHRTAAHLHKILPSMPPFIEVTLSGRRPRHREGLRIHLSATVSTERKQGLLTTTPLQTIAQLPSDQAERARAEALVLRLIPRQADDTAEPTRSRLERALLPALDKAGLPKPLVNHRLHGHERDFVWPAHNVVVETDGFKAHAHRAAFESDRARDAALTAAGFAVVRFTYRQVVDETLKVVVQIAQVLARTPHHVAATPPAGG